MAKHINPAKILLINFEKNSAANISLLTGAEVVRGYISDHNQVTIDSDGNREPFLNYSMDTPPYECSMVFINLGNYSEHEAEFSQSLKMWTKTETNNLFRYWSFNQTLLVLFVGDTEASTLSPLGVPIELVRSSGVDTQTTVVFGEDDNHFNLIEELNSHLKMPNTKYLRHVLDDSGYYRIGSKPYNLIRNKNGDLLALALTKSNSDYSMENPGVFILPAVKKPETTVAKLVKYFGDHYGHVLSDDEWHNSDIFYPQSALNALKTRIDDVVKETESLVARLETDVSELKNTYNYLRQLLTEEGDILLEAVYKVLTDLLKLKVEKSDEKNKNNPKEDLLVHYLSNKILLEIKGTTRKNPSLKFPQQAMQHALRQGLKDIAATGLILNHDRETDPKNRTQPYSDIESKELISDIHFIDTRVLHTLALAVIETQIKPEEAAAVLFDKTGRASFKPKK